MMTVSFRGNNFMYNGCVSDSQILDWSQNYRGMMFGMFHKPIRDVEEEVKQPFFNALRTA